MDKEVKERIVKTVKEKHRINYVMKEDLLKFVKENIDSKVKSNFSKAKLLAMAEEYLTKETLEEFYCLDRFGVVKGDLNNILNINQKTVEELIESNQLRVKNEISDTRSGFRKTIYIYSVEDILNLERDGNLKHKKEINREIREFELTDENLAEALYVINKSAKVSRDTKKDSYYEGRHRVCQAQKTRERNIYKLKNDVLKKLIEEGRAKYIGFNPNGYNRCMKLYQIARYTFHQPTIIYSPEDPELDECYKREEITEYISAEKKETSIKYIEAVPLLQKYLDN